LRKGDLLTGLPRSATRLLDLAQRQSSAGAHTGSDLVEVGLDDPEPAEVRP